MKYITIILLLVGINTNGQERNNSKYLDAMTSTINKMYSGNLQNTINKFTRISNAEKDEWLPNYYIAYLYTINSFGETDKQKAFYNLELAKSAIDKAHKTSNNSELTTIKALINTAYIAKDPITYAPKLGDETMKLYDRAIAQDSLNPRPLYLKAQFEMGTARFFGKDLTPYCKSVKDAIKLFDTFIPKSSIYPIWGKKQAQQIIEITCSKLD